MSYRLMASDWDLAEFLERAERDAPAIIAREGAQAERRPTLSPLEARLARTLERPRPHQATPTHRKAPR